MTFHYEVKVELSFTTAELKLLGFLAQHHYDSACKAIAERGGFLYGMNNWQAAVVGTHVLSFRQIDTLCKVLEQADMLGPAESLLALNRPDALSLAFQLRRRFKDALTALNDEHARLNPR